MTIAGIIFDVQTYCLHDGPGIRTTVFFKGCPLRCAWCHNPESWRREPEIGYLPEKCNACGACIDICPERTISLQNNRIVFDRDRCTACGSCVPECPTKAREIIGYEVTSQQIAKEAVADKPFFDSSGGGVTISGGEATTQPEFLLQTLKAIKKRGIHLALETCGCFPAKLLPDLLPLVDLFLFDLKTIDSERHQKHTGASNESILANFRNIVTQAGSERIRPRIPLIPGFNNDPDSIEQIITFLREVGYLGSVELMPYNRLAKNKWDKLGLGRKYRDMGELTEDEMERVSGQFAAGGYPVEIAR